jgi:hypothetical protein
MAGMSPVEPPDDVPATRSSFLSSLAFVLTTLPLVAWAACTVEVIDPDAPSSTNIWIGACILSLVGALLGFINAVRLGTQRTRLVTGTRLSGWSFLLGILSPILSFILGLMTLDISMTSGRALRRGGRPRVPGHGKDSGWVEELGSAIDAPPEVARAWRANAATEAASVAAFAHLANDLLMLGAPAHLIEKAHADAIDEIRHARLCYGLAAAMDGENVGPSSFPAAAQPRDGRLDVQALAAECIVESCLLESASARVAAALASHGEAPERIRAVLDTITADEARHAAHGWEIVAWCREVGGASVDAAMEKALARVEVASATAPVDHDALERWGIAGPALWRRCIGEALADIRARLGAASNRLRAA